MSKQSTMGNPPEILPPGKCYKFVKQDGVKFLSSKKDYVVAGTDEHRSHAQVTLTLPSYFIIDAIYVYWKRGSGSSYPPRPAAGMVDLAQMDANGYFTVDTNNLFIWSVQRKVLPDHLTQYVKLTVTNWSHDNGAEYYVEAQCTPYRIVKIGSATTCRIWIPDGERELVVNRPEIAVNSGTVEFPAAWLDRYEYTDEQAILINAEMRVWNDGADETTEGFTKNFPTFGAFIFGSDDFPNGGNIPGTGPFPLPPPADAKRKDLRYQSVEGMIVTEASPARLAIQVQGQNWSHDWGRRVKLLYTLQLGKFVVLP
jgi:hypothetical protein